MTISIYQVQLITTLTSTAVINLKKKASKSTKNMNMKSGM